MAEFVCNDCNYTDDESRFPKATNLHQRLSCGDIYTDVECPKCGALAIPLSVKESNEFREAAIQWLANGSRGASSEAIFTYLTGIDAVGWIAHYSKAYPKSASDLARCRMLLEAIPSLKKSFPKMAETCPEWKGIVERWNEICECMDQESPNWKNIGDWTAMTKTNAMLRDAAQAYLKTREHPR